VTKVDTMLWQGAPILWPSRVLWLCLFALSLGLAWFLVVASMQAGICATYFSDQNCRQPGFRSSKLIPLAILAMVVTALLTLKAFLGFPHERYSITPTEIIRATTWPFRSKRTQPLVHTTVVRSGSILTITGAGEKPIKMGPLAKGQPEQVLELIAQLKSVRMS
jgi:hypothetical protein